MQIVQPTLIMVSIPEWDAGALVVLDSSVMPDTIWKAIQNGVTMVYSEANLNAVMPSQLNFNNWSL